MKQNVADGVNGSFAATLIAGTIAGLTLQEWAAVAALTYSCLLILDKVGILNPMRRAVVWSASLVWFALFPKRGGRDGR